jgi:hypothetical protein
MTHNLQSNGQANEVTLRILAFAVVILIFSGLLLNLF